MKINHFPKNIERFLKNFIIEQLHSYLNDDREPIKSVSRRQVLGQILKNFVNKPILDWI